jgi:hypothetical protein
VPISLKPYNNYNSYSGAVATTPKARADAQHFFYAKKYVAIAVGAGFDV